MSICGDLYVLFENCDFLYYFKHTYGYHLHSYFKFLPSDCVILPYHPLSPLFTPFSVLSQI